MPQSEKNLEEMRKTLQFISLKRVTKLFKAPGLQRTAERVIILKWRQFGTEINHPSSGRFAKLLQGHRKNSSRYLEIIPNENTQEQCL